MPAPIYLDHSATTPARERLAGCLGAHADEICFTSGGTEADNLAVLGAWRAARTRGKTAVVVTPIEHKAVLEAAHTAAHEGAEERQTLMTPDGLVDRDSFDDLVRDDVAVASVMWVNNEMGAVQPVPECAATARERGVLFHTDAVQAAGKIPFDVNAMNVDLASLSAHKMYGPKGVGALYVRRKNPRVLVAPIIDGGGHERGMRSGTLNVPGIVGFGKAAEIASRDMTTESARLAALRDRLNEGLHRNLDDIHVNGSLEHRVPNNLNVSFAYVEGESLLMGISDVAVSSGSACTSASLEPSYVLKAMGTGDELAHSSIRFGLGRFNTEEEVDYVVHRVTEVVKRLREMSPLYELAKEGVDLRKVDWQK
jgi:cysteine desulfurase